MALQQARSMEQVLVALATNERVAACLRNYPRRDHAIESLEDDIGRQRHGLVADLRTVMRERSATAVASRLIRDEFVMGLRRF